MKPARDSKITVLTRAARLRGLGVSYLTALRDAGEAVSSPEVADLDEIIAWLNEMET